MQKKHLPREKAWRFHRGSFEEFLEKKPMSKRFETDNSYISKIAAKYLSCLFGGSSKIFCVKGFLTAQLRIAWETATIMIPLAKSIILDKLNKDKDLYYANNSLKKIRIDNRHHALDAIIIAYANRGYHNFLNRTSAIGHKKINYDKKNWISNILRPPGNKSLEHFKLSLREWIKKANISVKHDHNTNGELIKKTAYKIYSGVKENEYIIATFKRVSEIGIKFKEKPQYILEQTLCKYVDILSLIKNKELKKRIKDNNDIYNKVKDNLSKAEQELEESNRKAKDEGKKPQEITDNLIYRKACDMVGGKYVHLENKIQNKFFTLKHPKETESGFGYDTGDNLSLDLYHDKNGKLCGEIIRKIDFNKNKIPNYKNEGYSLLERIYQGDTLETDINENKYSLKIK